MIHRLFFTSNGPLMKNDLLTQAKAQSLRKFIDSGAIYRYDILRDDRPGPNPFQTYNNGRVTYYGEMDYANAAEKFKSEHGIKLNDIYLIQSTNKQPWGEIIKGEFTNNPYSDRTLGFITYYDIDDEQYISAPVAHGYWTSAPRATELGLAAFAQTLAGIYYGKEDDTIFFRQQLMSIRNQRIRK